MKKTAILVLACLLFVLVRPSLMSAKEPANPNVNDYIVSRNLAPEKVEYDHKNVFTKFNYRNGFGMVEGVVAHETANSSSTITSEIAYMVRNHENAFVHAFADASRVIEIHSPDYGAWGAGPVANKRFVHIELVRVKTFEQFVQSINNYANYIASILYEYNLPVVSAEKTGTGTLWSHYAVTKHLGGTTHGDPHGYFNQWGYNWDQFVQLVTMKYKELPDKLNKIENTSRLGQVRTSQVIIYKNASDNMTGFPAATAYTNETFYIKKSIMIDGETYYLLSEQPSSVTGVVGWVKSADLTSNPHSTLDSKAKTLYISGQGSAYSKPWGSIKDTIYKDLAKYKGKEFKIDLTEKVGNNTWYRGSLAGKKVWIHSGFLTKTVESSTSRLGNIKKSSVKIYKKLDSSSSFKAGTSYTNKVYYIKRQGKLSGQTYYLLSKNANGTGAAGWVKSSDLTSHGYTVVNKKAKTLSIKGKGSAYNKAWGGTKDIVYKKLSPYKNRKFKVQLTVKVGNTNWYQGKLAGRTVWMKQ